MFKAGAVEDLSGWFTSFRVATRPPLTRGNLHFMYLFFISLKVLHLCTLFIKHGLQPWNYVYLFTSPLSGAAFFRFVFSPTFSHLVQHVLLCEWMLPVAPFIQNHCVPSYWNLIVPVVPELVYLVTWLSLLLGVPSASWFLISCSSVGLWWGFRAIPVRTVGCQKIGKKCGRKVTMDQEMGTVSKFQRNECPFFSSFF